MRAIVQTAVVLLIGNIIQNITASDAANTWRAEHRLIDLHEHIDYSPEHLARAVKIMDAAGIGVAVDLSGDIVTSKDGKPSPFERNKALADKLFPGRFVHYMNLDYAKWNEPSFSDDAVRQIEEGHRLGAAGFKEYKRLGLYLRDKQGQLLKIDDAKLDPVWEKCGELKMPVSIHVADPRAFWLPYNDTNERWKELKDHRSWWFGDTNTYPKREELLEALNRVIERHPKTTFVAVHFANNAEDLDWVDRMLDKYPNMNADLAARIPEIGRQDPEKVRKLFIKHQDRIFFATDFQVYQQLTLGSGGSGPEPTDEDANTFFSKHWRWMETYDRNFAHMTPIQGDWTISGIALPDEVLRKIYFDNARKLLARSLPFATLRAKQIAEDFAIDGGELKNAAWASATPTHMEYESGTAKARPEVSTTVRALWTEKFLYLSYDSPYTELAMFEPAFTDQERKGLWDKDVVEAFIAPDPNKVTYYSEYEVAPTGEKIDLTLEPGKSNFDWSSHFEAAAHIDKETKHWTAVMKIPMAAFERTPKAGDHWRINTYRIDRANKAFLALNPTLTGSYHTPNRFGHLQFEP